MNSISSIGSTAMDGQNFQKIVQTYSNQNSKKTEKIQDTINAPTGAEVAQNLEQSKADIQEDIKQLQKMSDIVGSRTLQFNVNKELGDIVVKIVDPNTDTVVKEIPSREIQNLKVNMRKAIGLIFDDII